MIGFSAFGHADHVIGVVMFGDRFKDSFDFTVEFRMILFERHHDKVNMGYDL